MAAGIHMCSGTACASSKPLLWVHGANSAGISNARVQGLSGCHQDSKGKPGKVRQKVVTRLVPLQRMPDEVITS